MVVAVAAVAAMWFGVVSEVHAKRRSPITNALHATAAEPGAEGEVEEDVQEPGGTTACCLNGVGEQGCSDLTADECAPMGGTNLGADSTCDGGVDGQDPCGDSETCVDEPDGQNNDLRGGLVVTASGLAPRERFGVSVGDVSLGTLKTKANGHGRKRFRGRKLTLDPRGRRIVVTNADGVEVLVGVVADPTTPCGVACCLNTPEEQGCADLTVDECTAAGGVATGTGTCDADPCAPASPSGAFVAGPIH
jgi:hypothetical protein